MRSLSSVGLGLSIVFACLLVALLAELYYLLWWKKRFTRPDVQNNYSNPATTELLFILCCRNPSPPPSSSSSSSSGLNPKPRDTHVQEPQPVHKDLLLQPFGNHNNGGVVEDHHEFGNLGPGLMPRFLFTIMEETKEDLESEDGMSKRGKRSLSDLFLSMESGTTPYQTPLASPSLFTPPLTPLVESCCGNRSKNKKGGLYTFFESAADAEFNRLVRSSSSSSSSTSPSLLLSSPSPPPRFKFLRDAEEKLYKRRLMEMAEAERLRANGNDSRPSLLKHQQENGSLVRIIVEKSKEKESNFENREGEVHFQSSTSSQVLPLASSPSTTFRQPDRKC